MKMGGIEKGERKIEEKILFSFIWFKRENKMEIEQSGKKLLRAHKFLFS